MYSIGQFAIITKLNKKTLRYYDEIDLFKPAFIDPSNMYRYYNKEQIHIIKEILRLKELGIPLDEIKNMMKQEGSKSISEIYTKRLKEIDALLEGLKTQKKIIETYLFDVRHEKSSNTEFEIEEGYFMEEGYVFFKQINASYEDINSAISDFYSSANNTELNSTHIFKRDLEENTEGFTEIFAYTKVKEGLNVRVQTKEFCLRVLCTGIENRDFAYASLFDYIKNNSYSISSIYEKYFIRNGKMEIEIIIAC
jgi:DNA-binding transcriptional MerR regulator